MIVPLAIWAAVIVLFKILAFVIVFGVMSPFKISEVVKFPDASL